MNINSLTIEVTRRCNMRCAHCLRGNAQKRDIELSYIDMLMERVEGIGSLTFTGGEPSMNTEAIRYALAAAQRNGVSVDSFYIVTNGKAIPLDFVTATMEWYAYCWEKEMCGVALSDDIYHEEQLGGFEMADIKLLDALKYYGKHHINGLLSQGRAKKLGADRRPSIYDPVIEGCVVSECTLHLNVLGQIVNGCDWSYAEQHRHVICNVNELSLETLANLAVAG
jgi:hypothetical protein